MSSQITALPSAVALDGSELIPIVQDDDNVSVSLVVLADYLALATTLETIAELQAQAWTALTAPEIVLLKTNYATGDGGGIFVYVPLSTTADDGCLTIVATGSGLRYKRQFSGPVDVRWGGAKCDGATDDAVKLAAVLNNTSVKHALIPADTVLGSAVTILRDNLHIEFAHNAGARLILSVADIDGLVIGDGSTSRDNITIDRLGIAQSTPKTAGAALRVRKSTNVRARNFKISGQFVAVELDTASTCLIDDGRITDCKATTGIAIWVHGAADGQKISNISADNASNALYGLLVEETGELRVTDCDFLRFANGGRIKAAAAKTVENVWLSRNTWDTNGSTNLLLDAAATGTLRRVTIRDEWVATGGDFGAQIGGSGGTIDGIDWSGGSVLNNDKHGLLVSEGINIHLRDMKVSGNSQGASGTYHGIAFAAVSQFMVSGVRSGPFVGFSNTQGYGVAITSAGSDYFSVLGGDLHGNATGALSNAAGTSATKIVANVIGV